MVASGRGMEMVVYETRPFIDLLLFLLLLLLFLLLLLKRCVLRVSLQFLHLFLEQSIHIFPLLSPPLLKTSSLIAYSLPPPSPYSSPLLLLN